MRQRAVDHIVTHRLDFESFLGEDFGTYLREMSRSGVWGDELTLVRGRAVFFLEQMQSLASACLRLAAPPHQWTQVHQ